MPKMFYQITKNEKHTVRNKTDKNWKTNTQTFWPQEVKMTNKVLK